MIQKLKLKLAMWLGLYTPQPQINLNDLVKELYKPKIPNQMTDDEFFDYLMDGTEIVYYIKEIGDIALPFRSKSTN